MQKKTLKMIFPCKVDWNTMSPHEAGRRCDACNKVILDYSKEKNIKNGKDIFCGRFASEQIYYQNNTFEVNNFTTTSLSILALLGAILPENTASAQTLNLPVPALSTEVIQSFRSKFSNLKFPLQLSGKISDKDTRVAIANAEVKFLQQQKLLYQSKTDSSGRFSMILHEKDITESVFELIISYADTITPYFADTLFSVPLTPDSLKQVEVFSMECLIAPVVVAQYDNFLRFREPIITGGVVMPIWKGPLFAVPQLVTTGSTLHTEDSAATRKIINAEPERDPEHLQQATSQTRQPQAHESIPWFRQYKLIATLVAVALAIFVLLRKLKRKK